MVGGEEEEALGANIFCVGNISIHFLHLAELAQEANPSDHPRASTLFLNKSQTDGQYLSVKDGIISFFLFFLFNSTILTYFLLISVREKRKSNYMNHVSDFFSQ